MVSFKIAGKKTPDASIKDTEAQTKQESASVEEGRHEEQNDHVPRSSSIHRMKTWLGAKSPLDEDTTNGDVVCTIVLILWNVVFWGLVFVFFDFLKPGCDGTGRTYLTKGDVIYSTWRFGCVIREPIDDNVLHCKRHYWTKGTRQIKALFYPQMEMTLSDDLPDAVAFVSRSKFTDETTAIGWLAIDEGVECVWEPLDAIEQSLDSRVLNMLMNSEERQTCAPTRRTSYGNHVDFELPQRNASQPALCIIDLASSSSSFSSDEPVAPYNLIETRVQLSLLVQSHPSGRLNDTAYHHRDCNADNKIGMVGNLKTRGRRGLIGFKLDSCHLPPMEQGSQIVVAPAGETKLADDETLFVCIEEEEYLE